MKTKIRQMTADRAKFFQDKTQKAFEEHPYLRKLHSHLLTIDGLAVVLWNGTNDETTVNKLVTSGRAESGRRAALQLGEPSDCHENSARIHKEDPSRYEVRTGYALSKDGIWRPHSWVFDTNRGKVIETTEKREIYFGIVKTATNK